MVVVRPQSRRAGWLRVAAIAVGIMVLAIAAIFWASSRGSPVPHPEVTGVVERIQAELDVLQVSSTRIKLSAMDRCENRRSTLLHRQQSNGLGHNGKPFVRRSHRNTVIP